MNVIEYMALLLLDQACMNFDPGSNYLTDQVDGDDLVVGYGGFTGDHSRPSQILHPKTFLPTYKQRYIMLYTYKQQKVHVTPNCLCV